MWEQIARTSRDDLLKAVYVEEKLDMKKKCECKLTSKTQIYHLVLVNVTLAVYVKDKSSRNSINFVEYVKIACLWTWPVASIWNIAK